MMKRILALSLVLAFLFSGTALAAVNWQLAYQEGDQSFYFNPNTVRNDGSIDVICADLKTEMTADRLAELIAKYKDAYDVVNWSQISYSVSFTTYNRTAGTLNTKNHRFYDANNKLIARIPDEAECRLNKTSSVNKIYAAIIAWQYEE